MAKSKISVAKYLEQQLAMCGRPQKEIAEELGYQNANILTMFKTGKTKIPSNRILAIAKAIGVDPKFLLRLVYEEYDPETWAVLESIMGDDRLVTDDEHKLLALFRAQTGGLPVDVSIAENQSILVEAFKAVSNKDQAKAKASVVAYKSKAPNAKHK